MLLRLLIPRPQPKGMKAAEAGCFGEKAAEDEAACSLSKAVAVRLLWVGFVQATIVAAGSAAFLRVAASLQVLLVVAELALLLLRLQSCCTWSLCYCCLQRELQFLFVGYFSYVTAATAAVAARRATRGGQQPRCMRTLKRTTLPSSSPTVCVHPR